MVSDTANNTRKNQLPDLPVCKMLTEENKNKSQSINSPNYSVGQQRFIGM